MKPVVLVIPCFNEADRLRPEAFVEAAAAMPYLRFLFVDDGSTDATRSVVEALIAPPALGGSRLLPLSDNVGKAEAVRLGMLAALEPNRRELPFAVGYWDADLSTPLTELDRFVELLSADSRTFAVIGARVHMMGRRIERRPFRHYTGRVFATLAAWTLGFPVYDTQCGAKLFRAGPDLHSLFQKPFRGNWAFDVELLARIATASGESNPGESQTVVECPLGEWRDVPGSKVRAVDLPWVAMGLWRIWRSYRAIAPSRNDLSRQPPEDQRSGDSNVAVDGVVPGQMDGSQQHQ